jgi:hypothetical protein
MKSYIINAREALLDDNKTKGKEITKIKDKLTINNALINKEFARSISNPMNEQLVPRTEVIYATRPLPLTARSSTTSTSPAGEKESVPLRSAKAKE